MTTSRLVGLGASVLLSLSVLAMSPAHAATPVAAGRTVTVSEKVPTTVKAKVKGRTVSSRIARPVELQQLTGSTWKTVTKSMSSTAGSRSFTYRATVSTRLRVIAPRYVKTVRFTVKKVSTRVRVTLKAYVSPARSITVTPHTAMVSRGIDGKGSNGSAFEADVDGSGRYVAFVANATNLVDPPSGARRQVYLRDTVTGTTELVSRGVDGVAGDHDSRYADISSDGRFVVFDSRAGNLVDGQTNLNDDVFIWDRTTKKIELISQKAGGGAADDSSHTPSVSGDGRYVAFQSWATNLTGVHDGSTAAQIFRYDRVTGFTDRVSWSSGGLASGANGNSGNPSIDDSGRRVTFESSASNLVLGDTNASQDVFLWNYQTAMMTRVSRTPSAEPASGTSSVPRISGDGSHIVYESRADDIVAGDDNEANDIFLFDVARRTSSVVSRTPDGRSAESRSYRPDLDADGSVVVFESNATDLVAGVSGGQVFSYDAVSGRVSLVSATPSGAVPDQGSVIATVSGNGRRVVFASAAQDLVPGKEGERYDIYVRDLP